MEDDPDVEQLLEHYFRMCSAAGLEPLPPDEAREKARALKGVLIPVFELSLRMH